VRSAAGRAAPRAAPVGSVRTELAPMPDGSAQGRTPRPVLARIGPTAAPPRGGAVRPEVFVTDAPDPGAYDVLLDGLVANNVARAGPHNMRPLAVLVPRAEDGTVLGGLWGRTSWGWLFIELLFLPEALRGAGLGSEILRRAEEEASRRGCAGVWLDTFSIRARKFYERHGYAVFGTLGAYPQGHSRYFLRKELAPADAPPARSAPGAA
jgi:GNAT superfamily N-acetyltransferase